MELGERWGERIRRKSSVKKLQSCCQPCERNVMTHDYPKYGTDCDRRAQVVVRDPIRGRSGPPALVWVAGALTTW